MWASWATEVAADAFAFVHTGYAAVAGLHDVLAGDEGFVFQYRPGDPHPISYLRVLLGIEMCHQCFGAGPWDDLARVWTREYRLEHARAGVQAWLPRSLPLLPTVAEICLRRPMRAFGGRPLMALIDPERVKPDALFHSRNRSVRRCLRRHTGCLPSRCACWRSPAFEPRHCPIRRGRCCNNRKHGCSGWGPRYRPPERGMVKGGRNHGEAIAYPSAASCRSVYSDKKASERTSKRTILRR